MDRIDYINKIIDENIKTAFNYKDDTYPLSHPAGVLDLLNCFLEVNYYNGVNEAKRCCININGYEECIKTDLEILIFNDDCEIFSKLGSYIDLLTLHFELGFGLHKDAQVIRNKRKFSSGNSSYSECTVIKLHLEHLYVDLFHDKPEFRPALLKLIENKKTE